VLAKNTGGGTALSVQGVLELSRSGVATVPSGKTSVVVPAVPLTSSSLVFATIQGHLAGVGVAGVVTNVSGSSLTIYLTKAPSTALSVAWFIVG
jgi:hypothetical protein